ncbi:MAG: phage tail protein I [Shimia sp.]
MSEPSLLPPNATHLERALEAASAIKRPALDRVRTLMDPANCPANLLGYMAWALSVEEWDPAWSEAAKREVLESSILVHRYKGTVGAVVRALASLGMEGSVSEWFEYAGDPHTFRIDVLIEEVFAAGFHVNPALVETVARVIGNVKPERSHYDLRLGERLETTTYGRTGYRQRGKDKASREATPPTFVLAATATAASGIRERAIDRASFTPVERSAA